ncbi:MAG: AMIN domain-containing protein [Candidatus Firestonebacteria bacterium]|nr:AMIN domain-containing protein [Candidatus Firestonebacteria bacterium]
MKKIIWTTVLGVLLAAAGTDVFLDLPWGEQPLAAAETGEAVASPAATASPSASKAPAAAAAVHPKTKGVRLLQVLLESRSNKPAIRIVTTGRVRYATKSLSGPDRFLVRVEGATLTWKPAGLDVKQPPLQKIRAAQHGTEVWVVLDLDAACGWKVVSEGSGLLLTPNDEPKTGGHSATTREREPEIKTADEPEAAVTPVPAEASYKVVDVAVEDSGEKTRLVVTTDGPVRYRVEREKRGDSLDVLIHGASLLWNGKVPGLPKGAIRRVGVSTEQISGEPVVRLSLHLVQAAPYVVLKDQNQVMVELNNPSLVSEAIPSRGSLGAHVSVDFQNAEFVSVLRALAQDAGFDLVLSPGAQDLPAPLSQVTVSVNDQPFVNVLDMLLKPRKLAYAVGANTLRIGPASEFSPETRVFVLKNMDVKNSNLKESLEALLAAGTRSQVIVDGPANRVIVTAIPSDLIQCEAALARLDTPSRLVTRTFALSYAEVGKIAHLLKPMISSNATLDVNERENALVVTDIPGNMLRLSSLIRSLDKKSRQVMIEAKIVEVSLANEMDLGINWNTANDPGANPRVLASSVPVPGGAVGKLTVGLLQNGLDIAATLAVLESRGGANVISNPRIATLDHQTATLSASQNIPYNTSVVSNGVVRSGVEYLELPITLNVTPHISKSNQVLLSPTTLTVTTVTVPGNPPETATRTATTQMMVADGETVAIGGMVRNIEISKESKVPLLGDIPLLGYLFKSTVVSKDKVELVVFLTPHVLE